MVPFDNRRMRLDRIMMKHSKQFDIESIEMFGNEKIGEWYTYPSDHFGLLATFRLSKHGLTVQNNTHK